jgi:predicted heme/steroid binding protein
MKRFLFVFLLFLVACEPAETGSMTPEPDVAPEVESPGETTPEAVDEAVEEPPVDDASNETVDDPLVEDTADDSQTEESTPETETTEDTTSEESATDESEETEESDVFTAQTLAYYDGQEGRPAYVAVDGVVYDVTNSTRWRNGAHNGFQAGRDLTRQFNSQHGDTRLSRFPIVGTYVDE